MTQSRSIPDTHTLTSCQVPSHFWMLQVGLRGGWGQESWRRDMNRWWMRVKVNIKAPDRDDLMTEAVASTTAALPWASSPPSTPKIPAAGSEWHQSWRVSTTHTTTPQKKNKKLHFPPPSLLWSRKMFQLWAQQKLLKCSIYNYRKRFSEVSW